jgi:hypothetical protein
VGEIEIPVTVGGFTVSWADCLIPPPVAVIVAGDTTFTGVVAIAKVAVFDPAGTVTEAGTDAVGLFDEREITLPLGPALVLNVTVPTELVPPVTEDGETVRPWRTCLARLGGRPQPAVNINAKVKTSPNRVNFMIGIPGENASV